MNHKRERFKLSSAVFILLLKEGRFLGLRRGNTGWMDGYLSIPAGGLEDHETLKQAAIREAREEVGVEISEVDLQHRHTLYANIEGNQWIGHFFCTENWAGLPMIKEPDKHSELLWSSLDAIPIDMIPYVRQAIENIAKQNSYSDYITE